MDASAFVFAQKSLRFSSASALAAVLLLSASTVRAQRIHLRNYTGADGFAGAPVWRVVQDRHGFIWLGTADGATRYDGVRFTKIGGARGPITTDVQQILEDAKGNLWISAGEGLIYDGHSIASMPKLAGEWIRWPSSLDRHGNFWFADSESIGVFDGRRVLHYPLDPLPRRPTIYSVHPLGETVWLGTRGDGVIAADVDGARVIRFRRYDVADGLAAPLVRAIVRDNAGRVYFGTRGGGVSRLDSRGFKTFNTTHGLTGNDVYALLINRRGELVIGTFDNGVSICDIPDFRSCRSITTQNGLYSRSVTTLFEDREGTLWIGLLNGLTKVISESLQSTTTLDSLPADTVYSMFVDRDESLWVGTFQGLARRAPDGSWKSYDPRSGLPASDVRAILRDRRGRLWVGTGDGLCSLGGDERFTCGHRGRLSHDYVVDLAEDREARLWIGTAGGVSMIDPTGNIRNIETPAVSAIAVDPRGRVWVATDDNGILVIDGDRRTRFSVADGLPANQILDVHADSSGAIWAGTHGGGLAYLPPGSRRFQSVAAARLGSTSVSWIMKEDDKTVWVGTGEGVFKIDPSNLSYQQPFHSEEFTARSGIVWHVNAKAIDPRGNLWFALDRGLARFRKADVETNLIPPPVTIERLSIDERTIFASFPPGETRQSARTAGVQFPHGRKKLRFEFRGLSFRDERDVRFRTRLSGFEDGWSEATTAAFKEYTNLDPGRYAFRVIAANGDGVWSTIPATFAFEVLPPFWKTLWFRGLTAVAFLCLVLAIYKLRTRAIRRHNLELQQLVRQRTAELEDKTHDLEKANEEIVRADAHKDRFLASVSHELRTPLNAIIGFSDVLMRRGRTIEPDKLHKFHNNINVAGYHLLNLINNILDMSKIEAGKMSVNLDEFAVEDSISDIGGIVRGIADPKRIDVRIDVAADLPLVVLDVAKIRQTLLNLVSNAVKFSPNGSTIHLIARMLPLTRSPLDVDSLEIVVTDQGVGIAEEELPAIFREFEQTSSGRGASVGTGLGLALVKQFTEMQGGTVSVTSSLGHGTSFHVVLPLRPRDLDDPQIDHRSRQ